MTEMFGEAWSPMSAPDLAPDDDESNYFFGLIVFLKEHFSGPMIGVIVY